MGSARLCAVLLNRNMKRKILNIIICLLLICFCAAGYHIVKSLKGYLDASKTYMVIRREAVVDNNDDPKKKQVDFSVIKERGGSAALWIYIPNTNIDYPLVQGENNEFYLSKDIFGKNSKAGAIFLNSENDIRMSDVKSIIFGHNMKDGSMFHDLRNYKEKSYAMEHKTMYLYHEDGSVATYQLIGTLKTVWNSPIYTISTNDTVEGVLEFLEKNAEEYYGAVGTGNLIFLSTCIKDDERYGCAFQKVDLKSGSIINGNQIGANIGAVSRRSRMESCLELN